MPRVVKRFTVPALGAGRPDYAGTRTISKSILVENQEKWTLNMTTKVSGGGCIPLDFYQVPEGKKLHIGGGFISCSASCIQNVRMLHTPGMIGDFRYDMRGELIFTQLAGQTVPSGDKITVYVFNNDTEERDFSVTLTGFLEKVGLVAVM